MKTLLAAICIVLVIGVGLIMKQMQDARVAAAAQRVMEEQKTIRATNAANELAFRLEQDRARQVQQEQRHELLSLRYQMAQTVWSALEAPPEQIRFYRSCLEFKEKYGEWGHKRCAQLNKQLDEDAKELDYLAHHGGVDNRPGDAK